jgi:hypothetical protein
MPSIDVYVAGGPVADRQTLAGVLECERQPGSIAAKAPLGERAAGGAPNGARNVQ